MRVPADAPRAYERIEPAVALRRPGARLGFVVDILGIFVPVVALLALVGRGVPLWMAIVATLVLSGLGTLIPEAIWPYQRVPRRSPNEWVDDLVQLAVYDLGLGFFGAGVLATAAGALVGSALGVRWWPHGWPAGVQILLAVVVLDFFAYWRHRLQHETGDSIWWRIHSVHHSIDFLDGLRGARGHPLENIVVHGPGAFVVGMLGGPLWVSCAAIACITPILAPQHVNTDLRRGAVNYVLVGPEAHRWHHHQNSAQAKNYANVFAVWDLLFGTFNLPRPFDGRVGLEHLPDFPRSRTRQALLVFPAVWRRLRDAP